MTPPLVSRETKTAKPASSKPVIWAEAQWVPRVAEVVQACGVSLRQAQVLQLAKYMALLQQWNGTYNLTALRQPEEMLTHHLADCLVVLPPLLRHLQTLPNASGQDAPANAGQGAAPNVVQVLDVGSGGGLPGVVLAVACEQLAVTCVDTVGKKAAFVRQVSAALVLPRLKAVHARVESLQGAYEVITSRAFASLPDFVQWTQHLLAPKSGVWMAMKGQVPETSEVALLAATAQVCRTELLQVPGLNAQRCLIWMQPSPRAA